MILLLILLHFVAKTGLEPVTFGLWIQRSNHLSYLAIFVVQIYKRFAYPQNIILLFYT